MSKTDLKPFYDELSELQKKREQVKLALWEAENAIENNTFGDELEAEEVLSERCEERFRFNFARFGKVRHEFTVSIAGVMHKAVCDVQWNGESVDVVFSKIDVGQLDVNLDVMRQCVQSLLDDCQSVLNRQSIGVSYRHEWEGISLNAVRDIKQRAGVMLSLLDGEEVV